MAGHKVSASVLTIHYTGRLAQKAVERARTDGVCFALHIINNRCQRESGFLAWAK